MPSDDPRQRKPDVTLASARLGWSATTALRDGLTKTIAYFEDSLRGKTRPIADAGRQLPAALHALMRDSPYATAPMPVAAQLGSR